MGTYNETTTDEPDVLYAETENSMTANYAFKSITEFTYGAFPDPADSITWDAKLTGSELRRIKTGHT